MQTQATWQRPTSANEDGYRVYQSINGAPMALVATMSSGTTFASIPVDNSAPGGYVLNYQVTAFNSAGEGPPSNQAQVTTPPTINVPSAPGNLFVQLVIS